MLDPDEVNEVDAIGRSTPMYAIHEGTDEHLEILKLLIDRGVDLNHQANGKFPFQSFRLDLYAVPEISLAIQTRHIAKQQLFRRQSLNISERNLQKVRAI